MPFDFRQAKIRNLSATDFFGNMFERTCGVSHRGTRLNWCYTYINKVKYFMQGLFSFSVLITGGFST